MDQLLGVPFWPGQPRLETQLAARPQGVLGPLPSLNSSSLFRALILFFLCPLSILPRLPPVALASLGRFPPSLVSQTIKNLPAMQETRVRSRVRKIPWSWEWLPTAVFLPGESYGQRNLAGYSPWGGKESDMTNTFPHPIPGLVLNPCPLEMRPMLSCPTMETAAQGAAGYRMVPTKFWHFPYSTWADVWQMKFRYPLKADLATIPTSAPS